MDPKQHEKIAVNVSTVTIVINLALAGFKFLAGFLAHSGAMVSDAVHSASDVLATFIVILGVKLAGREHVLAAYEEAVKERYRFFSFGDAMFIS